ncbi:Predicted phosphoesterase [Algoriphagus alkaliphilus]|uniref:Predicted phosphoesterase n=1 Tax=Algoriphagus alkaliphilus TaxID=279824 RepID=A0A1G5ZKL1_9BACT|nr:metallophosphoesterase [Algoriphagus alkaliphilus]SDA95066.1 Predicted phosphoesterase [Algoriphagus alkaliphilus]
MGLASRRDFLKTSALSVFSMAIPEPVLGLFSGREKIKLGLISDLHADIIHDGELRLQAFLMEMQKEKTNALIQMGDFAIPKSENSQLILRFNSANPISFHVLGNHDMDEGFTKEEVAKAYGMPALYYAVDLVSIKMIVLDGNDPDSVNKRGGYDSYIGPSQQAWLLQELEMADKPVLIVSHQPIAGIYTIDNALEIQEILSRFASKILLAINGHAHVDQHVLLGGVNYLHINSASYYWVGEKLAHESLSAEIHQTNPSLKFTCPYLDPLFALLTIDPKLGKISVQGRKSKWIGPSPLELGYSILNEAEQQRFVNPKISNRKID